MQYRKILFLLFFFSALSYSQNGAIEPEIKEYKKLILESTSDTSKINLYRKISTLYSENTHYEKAIENEGIILELAKKNKNEELITTALYNLLKFNFSLKKYEESLSYGRKVIPLAKKIKYNKLDQIYLTQGQAHNFISQPDSAIINFQKLLNISESKDNLFHGHTSLGEIYSNQYRFTKSMEQFMISRELAQEINDPFVICKSIVNIGVNLSKMERFDEAITYFDEAIKIAYKNNFRDVICYSENTKGNIYQNLNEYDKALASLEIADEIAREIDNQIILTYIIYTQGDVYRLQKKYDLAISKYNKTLLLEKKIKSNIHQPYLYTELAKVYYEMNELETAEVYLDSVVATKTNYYNEKDYEELLSKIYANKKEYEKAYLHYKGYVIIRDSIDSIARKSEAYALEANYQFKQKEDEIEILNTKNKLQKSQLYAMVGFVGLVLLILLYIYSRFKAKIRANKQLEELDRTKTRFFTNISHEFRTPLSLMLGPIQTVLKNVKDPSDKSNLNLAYKNGTRLHNMVNQLLDLSKIESNSIPLEVEEIEITDFIRVIYSYFNSMADEKEIDYKLTIDDSIDTGFLDKDKVEKILINLLSNAFKFTPNEGSIKVSAYKEGEQLIVSIRDSGIGIHKDKIDKIFNRFYQVDDSHTRTAEGSGIGLALSKELADAHKGSLKAISREEEGSKFTLKIPIKKGVYNAKEIKVGLNLSSLKNVTNMELSGNKLTPSITENKKENPLLLLVEDNIDMQNFIASILGVEYNIIIASNGKEAYSIALEKIPDIIISDYMMPIMDGMSFSKMIRDQEATSHIPIVMLTAKNEQSTKLESLEIGVTSFLTKPFNINELQLVVNNIMKQQNKLKNLYTESSTLSVKAIELPDSEKSFIERMMLIFEEKYGFVYFGVEQLSDDLCLSRVQIYRKVKALTGESPGDLLRNFRLEKAKILLEISSSNVGEISEKVGFGNQSNFAKKFKKHTGMSPSEYMAQKFIKK